MGNIRFDPAENADLGNRDFQMVIKGVAATLEELHINENQFTDEQFTTLYLETISSMPRLTHLNMSRNG